MIKYVTRDVCLGIKNTGVRVLFYAVIIAILTYTGTMEVGWLNMNNYGWAGLVSLKLLSGVGEYNLNEGILYPPIEWITMIMLVIYIFADYMYDDMNGLGVQKITRIGKRRWFVSKCVWIILETVICVSLIYLIPLVIACVMHGNAVPAVKDELLNMTGFYGMLKDRETFNMNFVVVPFACCMTLAVWTSVLGMILEPAKAFMSMSIYIVVGVYYMSPYLIGNQLMLSRNPYINPDGCSVADALWIDMVLITGGLVMGYMFTVKKDYIEMRRS